jgi:four helix bundle protein
MVNNEKKYDLEERTAVFGEEIIRFCKKVPRSPVNDPLITQAVKSGTSVGANYCEADDAESRLDFNHKIGICKKESRESKHWLRMIAVAVPELKEEARRLWREAKELNLIFNAIIKTSRKNGKK